MIKIVAAVVVIVWASLAVAPAAFCEEPKPAATPSDLPSRQPDQKTVFKTTPQGDLKLHVWRPSEWKAEPTRPAIVFWYGGGFQKGSVAQFSRHSTYFATRGLVCICPEYRIKSLHSTEIDQCVEDARSAMRWIKSHASELGIDPDKVIAAGGSAGGTLALDVALGDGPDSKDDNLMISTRPCALVLFNPAQGQFVERIARQIAGSDAQKNLLAEQLAAIDRPEKGQPPAIFFFGTNDPLLEPSREFCDKALTLGNRCELWTAKGQRHTFFNRPPWLESTVRKADEFLASLGYLHGAPTIAASAVLERELPREEGKSHRD